MNFGFDIHGVVSDRPEQFKALMSALIQAGHDVHIITGGREAKAKSELCSLGIEENNHYTHFFSIADHHYKLGTPMTLDAKGDPHMDPETWNRTKAMYCCECNIDLHFDDSDLYQEYFTTPYARLYTKDRPTRKVRK